MNMDVLPGVLENSPKYERLVWVLVYRLVDDQHGDDDYARKMAWEVLADFKQAMADAQG